MFSRAFPVQRPHHAWVILLMATLTVFGSLGLARFGYSAVLPSMQEPLNLDNAGMGMLATFNLTGYLVFSAIGGALATRWGPRLIIAAGLALSGFGMFLIGSSTNLETALLGSALTGIGSGGSNMPVMGLLSVWFASSMRGRAAGVAVTGSSFGLILVGFLAPELISVFGPDGWRACWYVFGGICLVLSAVTLILLKNHPSQIGLSPLGKGLVKEAGKSAAGPFNWKTVYRSRRVWHLGLVYVAFGFSYIIYVTFFVTYLVSHKGYTHAEAGNRYMLIGWSSLLCGVIWGSVSDRIGRGRALALVYLIQGGAYAVFGLWHAPAAVVLSAVLFGLTAWSIPAIIAASCGDLLDPRLAPATLGFITLFFGVGQALGPFAAGVIADAATSYSPVFLVAAAAAVCGALGALPLQNQESN